MKYAFIQNHIGEFTIVAKCRVLGASRSGFYFWSKQRQQASARQRYRALLDQRVAAAFFIQKKRYGSLGLVLDLKDQGHSYNRKTVATSMRRQDLRAKAGKKIKATTNSKHSLPVAPNLLQQDFKATSPAQYQNLLVRHELTCSMSGKGNCYDNAVAESFFHSLKVETIHGEMFDTHAAMRQTVFEYIEVDYNRSRRHSANGYLSPEAFEALKLA